MALCAVSSEFVFLQSTNVCPSLVVCICLWILESRLSSSKPCLHGFQEVLLLTILIVFCISKLAFKWFLHFHMPYLSLLTNADCVTQRAEYSGGKFCHICRGWSGGWFPLCRFHWGMRKHGTWIRMALHIAALNVNIKWVLKIKMQWNTSINQFKKQNTSSCQSPKIIF